MNRLHRRYFFLAILITGLTTYITQLFIGTLLVVSQALTGAALVAGWWAHLVATLTVAIMGARKSAELFTEPAKGRIAGGLTGVWVGFGAAIGLVISVVLLLVQNAATVNPGLIVFFCLLSFGVAVLAGSIAGRETAHPPEEVEA
jgi:hypothetical protein